MGARDPTVPQSDDADLAADLIRLLKIIGPLGRLSVSDLVVPVVNMGDVVTRTITVLQPAFRASDVFSNALITAPAAGAILADTGQLAAGVYDVRLLMVTNSANLFNGGFVFQHRNAANAANIAVWHHLERTGGQDQAFQYDYTFAYEIALNERLRIAVNAAGAAARVWTATIFARRRT